MPVLEPDVMVGLLAPIPGASPAGRDLRYDPRYDAIREARREDPDLPRGPYAAERKLAEWPRVERDAAVLLALESKDLQLAAWLTEALLRRSGLRGLADGLAVLAGLLVNFWDGLYPALEDGDSELRLGAVEWVGGRLDTAVREVALAPDGLTMLDWVGAQAVPSEQEAANPDRKKLREARIAEGKRTPEAVLASVAAAPKAFYVELVGDARAALDALDALERVSAERFAGDPPSYRPLRTALDEVLQFAGATLAQKRLTDPDPLPDEPPDAVAPGGAGADDAAPPNGGASTASAASDGPVTSAADAVARVTGAAHHLRRHDATSPVPYLLLRALRWGELRAAPGGPDVRLLEPAPAAARARLKTLLLDGDWAGLLEQCEQTMATPAGRGWLDLQRYALTACARLGPAHAPVAAAIRGELAVLLAALPRLPALTLMDDTPVANGETLAWLAAEGLWGAPAVPPNGAHGTNGHPPGGADVLAAALAGEGAGDALAGSVRGLATARPVDGVDAFGLARAELARGRTSRAVELLVAEMDRERSARGRFVRETQIAQVMVEAGLADVARPILRRLVDVIKERALETWESGPLVAQPLVLMYRVMDGPGVKPEEREELYLRVCRLDPLQAMALRKGT